MVDPGSAVYSIPTFFDLFSSRRLQESARGLASCIRSCLLNSYIRHAHGASTLGRCWSRSTSTWASPKCRSSVYPTHRCARAANACAPRSRTAGFDLPPRVVVVNLAPADLKKEGNHLDLAIAVALAGRPPREIPAGGARMGGSSAGSSGSTAASARSAAAWPSPTAPRAKVDARALAAGGQRRRSSRLGQRARHPDPQSRRSRRASARLGDTKVEA